MVFKTIEVFVFFCAHHGFGAYPGAAVGGSHTGYNYDAGQRLDFWPVSLTNVAVELASHPDTILLKSGYKSLRSVFMQGVLSNRLSYNQEVTMLLPFFRKTMSTAIDGRLPEGEQGLGLVDGLNHAKFYPVQLIPKDGAIEDEWLGRPVRIERNPLDGVPAAVWRDTGEIPMQLLSRWYGFSFTYPACEIYTG